MVTEKGPVKYVGYRKRANIWARQVRSERVACSECGKDFWRWKGKEVCECAHCQLKARQ